MGRGSTFTFSFTAPLGRDAEIRRVSREELNRAERPRSSKPGGLNARILVAEDGRDNQRLIKLILRNAGAEVDMVENGLLAVETLRADPDYDLVVMDMAMPEMDGYEATRLLRAEGFQLPIVALTAHALTGEREKCIASGCDDYTTKPIDKAALIETLHQNLLKHREG
jgi:CheY-like chemotaxis protein